MGNFPLKMWERYSAFVRLVFSRPSSISDPRLEALLHQRVHIIEKDQAEEKVDLFSMIWARKLFLEAKKRALLSEEGTIWSARVLFGQQPEASGRGNAPPGGAQGFDVIIKSRRSIRSYGDRGVKNEEFEELVDAARWAPSSCHRQPWHFVLTRDKEKIAFLSEKRGQKFVAKAPSCILVVISMAAYKERESCDTPFLDAGAAVQNLLLSAEHLGLAACWVNFGNQEVSEADRMEVNGRFHIPDGYRIVSLIPIGTRGATPGTPGRKAVSQLTHYEEF